MSPRSSKNPLDRWACSVASVQDTTENGVWVSLNFLYLAEQARCAHNRAMGRILSLMAFGLVGAGAAGMVFFFAAGWEGWTIMAAGAAVLAGALWLYSDFAGDS